LLARRYPVLGLSLVWVHCSSLFLGKRQQDLAAVAFHLVPVAAQFVMTQYVIFIAATSFVLDLNLMSSNLISRAKPVWKYRTFESKTQRGIYALIDAT